MKIQNKSSYVKIELGKSNSPKIEIDCRTNNIIALQHVLNFVGN